MKNPVTVSKCSCGQRGCSTYWLSVGNFYQGSGFKKEDADRLALCWNMHDAMVDALRMVSQHGRIDNSESRMNQVAALLAEIDGAK